MTKIKKVKDVKVPRPYHISFMGDLAGKITPRHPDGSEDMKNTINDDSDPFPYPEPSLERLSLSPTIEQCFIGVYPNVEQYFSKRRYPYMEFHVYSPVFTGSEKVVTNKEILENKYVWDAHLTGEYWITSKVTLEHVGKVRIYRPKYIRNKLVYPFGDRSLPLLNTKLPDKIEYDWVESD